VSPSRDGILGGLDSAAVGVSPSLLGTRRPRDDREGIGADDDVRVEFPELPVGSYLRLMAWSHKAGDALLGDPALESVARAHGVLVHDRALARLHHRCAAVFAAEAARTVRRGGTTMAPVVSAPLRLWRDGVANNDRALEWFERLRHGSSAVPLPPRDIEATQRRLADAVRSAYGATH
jgi:hypothetical protein